VQVAVRLGRKPGMDSFIFSRANILRDNVANKIRRRGSLDRSRHCDHTKLQTNALADNFRAELRRAKVLSHLSS